MSLSQLGFCSTVWLAIIAVDIAQVCFKRLQIGLVGGGGEQVVLFKKLVLLRWYPYCWIPVTLGVYGIFVI